MKRRYIKWTREKDEYLFKKRAQGEAYRFIAATLGSSPQSAVNRYKKLCAKIGISPYRSKMA